MSKGIVGDALTIISQGYQVLYTPKPQLPLSLWTLHQADNSDMTTISNLHTDETYALRVLAFTVAGDGPLSDEIQVKTTQGGALLVHNPFAYK